MAASERNAARSLFFNIRSTAASVSTETHRDACLLFRRTAPYDATKLVVPGTRLVHLTPLRLRSSMIERSGTLSVRFRVSGPKKAATVRRTTDVLATH